ncbi:MAG: hypothetical protein QM784_38375 [Polyangiaceae bacterium]
MTKFPPPLLGYNNNVRYRGRTFHIQTEDSGIEYTRIVTHLFVDGGRIVKSTRTQYNEVLDAADMAEVVRRMMKEQHKAMFLSLRAGEFDDAINRIVGTPPDATITPMPISIEPQSLGPDALAAKLSGSAEAPAAARGAEPGASPPRGTSKSVRPNDAPPAATESTRPRRGRSSAPPALRRSRVVDDPTPVEYLPPAAPLPSARPSERPPRASQSRPAAVQKEVLDPRSQSIFGDSAEGRQTLDEVILSFLEEEEN